MIFTISSSWKHLMWQIYSVIFIENCWCAGVLIGQGGCLSKREVSMLIVSHSETNHQCFPRSYLCQCCCFVSRTNAFHISFCNRLHSEKLSKWCNITQKIIMVRWVLSEYVVLGVSTSAAGHVMTRSWLFGAAETESKRLGRQKERERRCSLFK